jgi:hypothetical protein
MGERETSFKRSMALKIVALIIAIIGLLTAYIGFVTKVTPETRSPPSPSISIAPRPVTASAPDPGPNVSNDGPPYYDANGDRVDLYGQPCGNGSVGHAYNAAQECWVP